MFLVLAFLIFSYITAEDIIIDITDDNFMGWSNIVFVIFVMSSATIFTLFFYKLWNLMKTKHNYEF